MNLKNAINILNIEEFKSVEDLKRLFRVLAHKYHPDKNPDKDTGDQFRQVITAYEFCLDHIEELCAHFDAQTPTPVETESARDVIENLDDIFEDIFGFSQSGRVLGYHEPQEIFLTVDEFINGATKRQKMVAYRKCPDCSGAGAKDGAHARVCSHCFGKGIIKKSSSLKKKAKVCPKCGGRGRNVKLMCEGCNGFGRLKQYHSQEITIPIGLQPLEIYTLTAFDRETKLNTEVFIRPCVLHDDVFQIDHYDLLCQYHIDFNSQSFQNRVRLLTPAGEVELIIPQNVQDRQVVVVKGAGLFKGVQKRERGDLKVLIRNKKPSLWRRFWGGIFGA